MITIKIFTPKGDWLILNMQPDDTLRDVARAVNNHLGNQNPRAYLFGAQIHIFTRDQLDMHLDSLGCQDESEVMFQVENFDGIEKYNLSRVDTSATASIP